MFFLLFFIDVDNETSSVKMNECIFIALKLSSKCLLLASQVHIEIHIHSVSQLGYILSKNELHSGKQFKISNFETILKLCELI